MFDHDKKLFWQACGLTVEETGKLQKLAVEIAREHGAGDMKKSRLVEGIVNKCQDLPLHQVVYLSFEMGYLFSDFKHTKNNPGCSIDGE